MAEISMTRDEFNKRFIRFKTGIAIDLVSALQLRCPVDMGSLKNSIKWKIDTKGIEISMLGYAIWVEFGTPPHIIRPKNKKALAFKVNSTGPRGGKHTDQVVTKEVHHPGTKANPFIRSTFRFDLPGIVQENARRHLTA